MRVVDTIKTWWNCNKRGHRYKTLIVLDDPRVYAHCCTKCTYNLAYQLVVKKNGTVVRKRVKLINPPLATIKYRERMKAKRLAKRIVANAKGIITKDKGDGGGLTRQSSIDSAIPQDPGQRIFDSGSKSGPEQR
jgi:hypothetical protein